MPVIHRHFQLIWISFHCRESSSRLTTLPTPNIRSRTSAPWSTENCMTWLTALTLTTTGTLSTSQEPLLSTMLSTLFTCWTRTNKLRSIGMELDQSRGQGPLLGRVVINERAYRGRSLWDVGPATSQVHLHEAWRSVVIMTKLLC